MKKFNLGDEIRLLKNPLDEQFGEVMDLHDVYYVIEVKNVPGIYGTSGQWIKVNKNYNDWIDSSWFCLVKHVTNHDGYGS